MTAQLESGWMPVVKTAYDDLQYSTARPLLQLHQNNLTIKYDYRVFRESLLYKEVSCQKSGGESLPGSFASCLVAHAFVTLSNQNIELHTH